MTSIHLASIVVALTPLAALQEGGDPVTPSRDLHVTLVDSAGDALWMGWSVQLGRWSENKLIWGQDKRVDHPAGGVTFAGLSDEELLVRGVHSTGERTARALVRLAESGPVELTFEGPRPEVSLFVALLNQSSPDNELLIPARVVAIDDIGNEHELEPHGEQRSNYVARGIGNGRYRVEVHDTRFLPLLLDDAATGMQHYAFLRGSATLALRFIDSVDQRPVVATNGVMWVTLASGECFLFKGPGGPWWRPQQLGGIPSRPPSSTERTPIGPDGVHRIEGLMPGSAARVLALLDGHLEVELDTPAIAAGEVRAIDVALTRGLELVGRVADGHGAPIAGAFILPIAPGTTDSETVRDEEARTQGPHQLVNLRLAPATAEEKEFQQLVLRDLRSRALRSDPDGTFCIGGLALDTAHVLVSITPWDITRVDVTREASTPAAFPRATATAVVAHRGAVDVQLRQNGPRNLAAYPDNFEFALQIGAGPWRTGRDASRSLLDNDWCMRLRGLPLEQCRLRVTPRLADGTVAPDAAGRTFEFTPAIDPATYVEIDLSPLARR
jgi:hypothetical protein